MDNIALVMHGKQHLEFQKIEKPVPAADEVLIRVEYCGICGSDVHFYETGCMGTTPIVDPLILGHECAGVIEKLGAAVTQFQVGERVVVEPGIGCGHCEYCKSGLYNLCPSVKFISCPPDQGAMRRYLTHPAHWVHKLPDNVSTKEGALVEPLCVGLHAAKLGNVQIGKTVVILGAGCIGLTTLAACKAMGASHVIVSDLYSNRLDKALEMGADTVIHAQNQDTIEAVLELTEGRGADVVFETAGSRVTAAQTEALTRRSGVIVIVGNVMGETPMNFYKLAHKEITIKTVHRYRNVFPLAIQAISEGKIDIKKLATDVFPFEEGIRAFQVALQEKQTVLKVLLHMEDAEYTHSGKKP